MDISFVISEFRCLEKIALCLDALRNYSVGLSCEFIVSSNSEYAEEIQGRIREDFPRINWIFNDTNNGFAYAMNRGMERTAGEVIVLLNPDAYLAGDIGPAFRCLIESSEIAVLGPKIVSPKGELQDSARPFMTPWMLIKRSLARVMGGRKVLLEKDFDYERVQPVDWVIGAFMMAKKSAIATVGMLDEQYFMYVEDMDWCKRFWDNGFKVFYFPGLMVEFSGTRRSTAFLAGGKMPGSSSWDHARSYLRFLLKHRYFFERRSSPRD